MKFSYHWLKELTGTTLSPKKLAELLTLRSFEVESVEPVGRDWALDVKVNANRLTDAGGHLGLAREISAVTGKKMRAKFGSPVAGVPRAAQKLPFEISIADKALCSRYTAQVVNINAHKASPKWMQDRLRTCGLRPINCVVDVTNYVMLETGHPLHAFDYDTIRGACMMVRGSEEGEKITTLDGVERALSAGTIIIQDAERVIDLAGIMGGENSAVQETTTRIILQAAVFDAARIYTASRALNHFSAASRLYAAGVDPEGSLFALARAVRLLEKEAGASRGGEMFDWYPRRPRPTAVLFHPSYGDRLIGYSLGVAFYKNVFKRLGCMVVSKGENVLVHVPSWRKDITLEEDLVEEAVRFYGYENIPAAFPEVGLAPARGNDEVFWEDRLRNEAVSLGFTESELYEFASAKELEHFSLAPENHAELENPLNPDTQYLLRHPLIRYIISAKENAASTEDVRLFGIAKGFHPIVAKNGSAVMKEKKYAVFAVAQKGLAGDEQFYRLKGTVDELLERMGIVDHWYDDVGMEDELAGTLHPFRRAEIKVGETQLGVIGEISPVVAERIKSRGEIVAAQIDFDALWHLASAEVEYVPPGRYPAVRRDIAVIVPETTRAVDVGNIIENIGGKLLVETELFDYFQDEEMRGESEKSLAFHLVFESPARTLTDHEVDAAVTQMVAALEEQGWEVRK